MSRGHYGQRQRAVNRIADGFQGLLTKIELDRRADGQPRARIGGEWFHSGADRERALDDLGLAFQLLAMELMHGPIDRDPARLRAFGQWLELDVAPALEQWNAFAARERQSWWVRAATSWPTFLTWRERLKNLRQLARAHGIVLESPEPELLPMTIWEKSEGGASGNEAAPWFGLAKIVIGGAIALTGAITVYSVVKDYAHLRASRRPQHGKDT